MRGILIFFTFFMVLLIIVIIRTVLCKNRARILTDKTEIGNESLYWYYADRLAEMIRCKTISQKDSYDDAEFAKLRTVLEALFPLVHEQAERLTFGADCYLYFLKGTNTAHSVLLMSHHDVVPAEEGWKLDPFGGEIIEGNLWGRGTVDTKTSLFAQFSALEECLREGRELPVNVYLASSHNEEIAGDGTPLVVKYFQEKGIQLDWILDEGGAVIPAPMGGIHCPCAMLAVHEKGRHTLECMAEKIGGHASLWGNSNSIPVQRMAQFITTITNEPPFIRRISPPLKEMFKELAPYMNPLMRVLFANLWLFGSLLKGVIPKLNQQAAAMLGTTCTFPEIQGKEDGNPCKAKAFLRCVNNKDLEIDIRNMKEIAKPLGISLEDAKEGNEFYGPANLKTAGYQYIKSCVEHCFPYAACAPFILPAGTDARHFTVLCDCVIRFAPIDITGEQLASVHNKDEHISIRSIADAVSFYKYLLKQYEPEAQLSVCKSAKAAKGRRK